jgi:N-acetylmuramoyl-L-alanine amidase
MRVVLGRCIVRGTPMPVSNYAGLGGIEVRGDLGGLNLSTVPKVLIECGNIRNATDAALLANPAFRQQAAEALTSGLGAFLAG